MYSEYENKQEGYEAHLKSALAHLLVLINRHGGTPVKETQDYMSSAHRNIMEITGYVNNHFADDINLTTISDKFFISTCYFSRTFKKIMGLSFTDYLNSVRVKEAQYLLRNKNMSITEISEKVGFKSATHFGRIFKKLTGISPLAYKKRLNRNGKCS